MNRECRQCEREFHSTKPSAEFCGSKCEATYRAGLEASKRARMESETSVEYASALSTPLEKPKVYRCYVCRDSGYMPSKSPSMHVFGCTVCK